MLIDTYKFTLSGILGGQCRFLPTCSSYARECFRVHGVFKALRLTIVRICRCHPWGPSGHDPVRRP